jgi:hypothetical protein
MLKFFFSLSNKKKYTYFLPLPITTRTEYVAREKKVVDHYAVEYQTEYVPQVFHDRYVEYVPQERYVERVEYTPVERQVSIFFFF